MRLGQLLVVGGHTAGGLPVKHHPTSTYFQGKDLDSNDVKNDPHPNSSSSGS